MIEGFTLGWNVVGVVVLAAAATGARSVAPAGFGLDFLIEIGASTVVIWELRGTSERRQEVGQRLIVFEFSLFAVYLAVQSTLALAIRFRPHHSTVGSAWTAVIAAVMFFLAPDKAKTGAALGNLVLMAEGRITLIDGILAIAVLIGLVLHALLGWWWADPVAGCALVFYAAREARASLTH